MVVRVEALLQQSPVGRRPLFPQARTAPGACDGMHLDASDRAARPTTPDGARMLTVRESGRRAGAIEQTCTPAGVDDADAAPLS